MSLGLSCNPFNEEQNAYMNQHLCDLVAEVGVIGGRIIALVLERGKGRAGEKSYPSVAVMIIKPLLIQMYIYNIPLSPLQIDLEMNKPDGTE